MYAAAGNFLCERSCSQTASVPVYQVELNGDAVQVLELQSPWDRTTDHACAAPF